MIDKNKPIRFALDHDRPIALVGTMPNGDLVVTSSYGDLRQWAEPVVFSVSTGSAKKQGCTLSIENAPVINSGFYPMRPGPSGEPYGRGLVSLSFAKDEYQTAKYFVEIVRQDGVPVSAHVHAR